MPTFDFKCPATEILHGTAYFSVEAKTEKAARALLADDASEHFIEFSESDGRTEWDVSKLKDWELI